jgi:hypothetical protein
LHTRLSVEELEFQIDNANFDNTKSNIIERIIPKAIERITKVKKEITAPIMEVIKGAVGG